MIALLRIVFLLVLLLGKVSIENHAQISDYRFKHFTKEQGLSHNDVNNILQDSEGFMWFSSVDGLNKFDGYTFRVFKPDPDNPEQSLRSPTVLDIHEDQVGKLWIATARGGLHYLDKLTNQITHLVLNSMNENKWNTINNIHESDDGSLWVSGDDGVAQLDITSFKYNLFNSPENVRGFNAVAADSSKRVWCGGIDGFYQLDPQTGIFTPITLDSTLEQPPFISALYLDRDGILWVSTRDDGLFFLDTRLEVVKPQSYNPSGLNAPQGSMWFNDLILSKQGYLWVSSEKGLVRIDKQKDVVKFFRADPLDPFSITHDMVISVYEDQSENLWIGTVSGVDKLTSSQFHTYQIVPNVPSNSNFKPENSIAALAVDHNQKILFTVEYFLTHPSNNASVYRLNPSTGEVEEFATLPTNSDSATNNMIEPLYVDQKNRLWIGTDTALYLRDSTTGEYTRYPSQIPVFEIIEDPYGKLWFDGGGHWVNSSVPTIARFDPENGEFTYFTYDFSDVEGLQYLDIMDIMVSSTGDIWLACNGVLARFVQQKGSFISYLPNPINPEDHINDTFVLTTYEDNKGVIWIGTRNEGLNRYDPHTDNFTHFDMQDGLPSNQIHSIIEDKNGDLWLGTHRGLSRFNLKTEKFSNYNISDGLLANRFYTPHTLNSEGELVFGSDNGLLFFHPDSIQDNNLPPPVYITGFKVMEEEQVVPSEPIELPYDQNFLSFDFVALNYQTPEKNEYAYQMEGLDRDWVYSGGRRFASYTKLDPGEYTFKVKASHNKGPWKVVDTPLQLIILPPWWETTWAYAIYILLGIGSLYLLRRYTVKRERLKHALELQTMEAEKMHELDQLKSRFFANISHEFRTPLTLILGPLDKFIQQSEDDSSVQSTYRMMQRNARRLLRLVNQLLDLSKLESGSMKLDTKPQPIVPFLKSLALSFASLAERRQIAYQFQFPGGNPVVYFDADKLEKIVSNLLSNAFKFTPDSGQVKLSIQLEEIAHSTQQRTLELKVQDSGPGIPEELIEHIFDRFYQVESTLADEQAGSGSGIGLSLVRELVELHQGTISIENTPGTGACFRVSLPVNVADYEEIALAENSKDFPAILPEEEIPTQENSQTAHDPSKPLVLVVEDNADVRTFIRETLYAQYRLEEAPNGLIGLKQALATIPDLIVTDVMMPEMDGVTLSQKLKADERTSHIPIILLTAKASGADKITGLETGADDYMIKPFQSDELTVRIHNLIANRRKLRERYSQEITLQPTAVAVTSVDQQFLGRMKKIVERHLADTAFGVEAFSEEAGLSRVQLFRKLKALTDLSPSEFIKTMRLKRAADLLAQGAGTIGEVAFRVGFSDPSYFTKAFQKQYGQTPSDYHPSCIS